MRSSWSDRDCFWSAASWTRRFLLLPKLVWWFGLWADHRDPRSCGSHGCHLQLAECLGFSAPKPRATKPLTLWLPKSGEFNSPPYSRTPCGKPRSSRGRQCRGIRRAATGNKRSIFRIRNCLRGSRIGRSRFCSYLAWLTWLESSANQAPEET
jgi:hypothetical protein